MEVFEQGLYLYFRKYQPSYPILHSVTFNADKVSELLLFVMCMIGLSFYKTEDAVDFIRKTYPGILDQVYAQLIFAAADSQTPADLLNYLVLAHHTLFLFISTGGKLLPEKSRSLYLYATTPSNTMSLVQLYDTSLRESNPNCIVIWHSVCMLLTADINILSRAAGRDGPESMSDARRDITCWAYTPAARRACLHAAQTFRTLYHRKPADGTAFQSVRTLFMSALILGFYLLASPVNACLEGQSDWDNFDLANSVVDWKVIGDEGISNDGTASMAPHDSARLGDAAVRFIRFGGPILIDGKKYEYGARNAQRILLEFAGLLDEVGTHWMANYARLLYMVHDTMATPSTRS
ncbi:uncharacterized protein N7484_004390 [Penicillium longicatenatum]|uniref:uncharacterized protein n=1 Tax=Penicillium longicatenatum TaxID=1561947 RepID=UPI00254841FC|nr:uncharacterized protein N7484_004390 [Penicillium longicatenatum]KAJ5650667.1 hypothetical protein N7484_004390 [Penicillium longicatenatum]